MDAMLEVMQWTSSLRAQLFILFGLMAALPFAVLAACWVRDRWWPRRAEPAT
jgi:hypothetical protein